MIKEEWKQIDALVNVKNKLLEENERLKEVEKEHKNCTRKHWQQKCAEHCANEMIYKSRNEKAIELIKEAGCYDEETKTFCDDIWEELPELLNILNGGDDNE